MSFLRTALSHTCSQECEHIWEAINRHRTRENNPYATLQVYASLTIKEGLGSQNGRFRHNCSQEGLGNCLQISSLLCL